jgi:dipeptidyl aminopeptidase/acylaminoacyl peptidase
VNLKLSMALFGLVLVAAPARSQQPLSTSPRSPSEVRADFLKLLDRPRVPLDAKSQEIPSPNKALMTEKVSFAVEARPDGSMERVPALVVRPASSKPGEKLPVVIVLHGTGGTKEGNRSWLDTLANRGFLAVAIDGRYHGERAGGMPGTKAYNDAITRAWRSKSSEPQTYPFYYDTCWDIWRTIDYLGTRADVDPERIGLIGISKGGIETWLAAAVDERIKVAVPAISVQSFRWGLEHERYQARANTIKEAHEAAASDLGEPKVNARVCRELWAKIIPGILDEFDGPSMLRLFSDRSLLILSGDRDPNCPIEGAEIAFASARAAFHEAKADEHLKIMVAKDSGHTVTKEQRDAAIEWFVEWLKPAKK